MNFNIKPLVVSADRWMGKIDNSRHGVVDYPIWNLRKNICENCGGYIRDHGWLETENGGNVVCPGDWVIVGESGEKTTCHPNNFSKMFDPLTPYETDAMM